MVRGGKGVAAGSLAIGKATLGTQVDRSTRPLLKRRTFSSRNHDNDKLSRTLRQSPGAVGMSEGVHGPSYRSSCL